MEKNNNLEISENNLNDTMNIKPQKNEENKKYDISR